METSIILPFREIRAQLPLSILPNQEQQQIKIPVSGVFLLHEHSIFQWRRIESAAGFMSSPTQIYVLTFQDCSVFLRERTRAVYNRTQDT